jgi:hypothetical protein
MSTYEERQRIRDANPGVIVDADSVYNPSTGVQTSISNFGGSSGGGGGNSGPSGNGGGGAGTGNSLDQQFQKMLSALASGNQQAFEFEKEKFNQQFAESQREFNAQQGLNEANVTGLFNGQPTEAARQFNQTLAQRNAEFQGNLGTSLLNAATQIRGPQDYLQYQQFTHGGQNLMQQLFGNQPIPQGGQPAGPLQSASIQSVLRQLGILPGGSASVAPGAAPGAAPAAQYAVQAVRGTSGGMNNLGVGSNPGDVGPAYVNNGQVVQEVRNPDGTVRYNVLGPAAAGIGSYTAFNPSMMPAPAPVPAAPASPAQPDPQQQLLARFGLTAGQGLNPTQINPARYDQIGPVGQSLTRNLAETSFGYDPNEFEAIINAQRPLGAAVRGTNIGYRQPTGIF